MDFESTNTARCAGFAISDRMSGDGDAGLRPHSSLAFDNGDETTGRPLSEVMRERTAQIHAEAERTGIVADILRRKADRQGYAVLLRNLLPVYERLEAALVQRAGHPVLAPFACRELHRSQALRRDLNRIHGDDFARALPLLPSAEAYADHVSWLAKDDEVALVAHAYVRYFGDLSGGQILKKLLGKALLLPADMLTFYEFDSLVDPAAAKRGLRAAIDLAGRMSPEPESLIAEAICAFRHNIRISCEVQLIAGGPAASPV